MAADFYLSCAGEMRGDLATPRACKVKSRLSDAVNEHMLIEIDPPLIGQAYGLGSHDVVELVLSARHQSSFLFPVTEWPTFVYVSRIIDDAVVRNLVIMDGQVEIIGWGAVFRTLDDALALETS